MSSHKADNLEKYLLGNIDLENTLKSNEKNDDCFFFVFQ